MSRKEQADFILYKCGLLDELKKYGCPHIIGSYRMDMMAWNDLDIDVENSGMSLDKLYELSKYIINTFHPTWYEAKEECNEKNELVWFQGFEMFVENELWNVDMWFFNTETIDKAEKYCDSIIRQIEKKPELKQIIIKMKQELMERSLYSFDKYTSMDVYDAVLNYKITGVEDFLDNYIKHNINL